MLRIHSFDVSCDVDNEASFVVGHDSYAFNKDAALGPIYSKEIVCDDAIDPIRLENDYSSQFELDSDSNHSDLSSQFKLTTPNMLTSTLLDVDLQQHGDSTMDDGLTLLSKISKIEASVSSFFGATLKDLHELKETVKLVSRKRKIEPDSDRGKNSVYNL